MNNPDVYGNVCYRLNFSDAHKLGAISDFKILITQAKDAEKHVNKYSQKFNNYFKKIKSFPIRLYIK